MTHVTPCEMAEALVRSAPTDTAVRMVAQAYLDTIQKTHRWTPISFLKPSGRLLWFSDGVNVEFEFDGQVNNLPFTATYFMPMREYPVAPELMKETKND